MIWQLHWLGGKLHLVFNLFASIGHLQMLRAGSLLVTVGESMLIRCAKYWRGTEQQFGSNEEESESI